MDRACPRLFFLTLTLCTLLPPCVAVAQSPGDAPTVPTTATALGTWFAVHDDASLIESAPAVAYNSARQEYLVVWYNDRPGNDDVRARRLAADGRLLGSPFYVAAGTGAERYWPAVTYSSGSNEYLVVWQQQDVPGYLSSIHGRRVAASGQLVGTEIVVASSVAATYGVALPAPAYAATGDRYMVTWVQEWYATGTADLMGQVFNPDGTPDGGPITISDDNTGDNRWYAALAYNRGRDEYLVAWLQVEKAKGVATGIYARRVTAAGMLLSPLSTEVMYNAGGLSAPLVAAIPSVGGDGQYLVTAVARSATANTVRARHIGAGGTMLPAFDVSTSSNTYASDLAIAGSDDSGEYLVAWVRGADAPLVFRYVVGRSVQPTGNSLGGEFHVGGLFGARPAAVAGATGDFLVVFEDTPLGSSSAGIYARLYGERTYVPLALRDRR